MEKQRDQHRLAEATNFGELAAKWLQEAKMADMTRSMRKSILNRDLNPVFGKCLLCEVGGEDLRALCQKIKARGVPAPTTVVPN